MSKYRGITYPGFLSKGLFGTLWKKLMCTKNMHLWDEVESVKDHYLVCDVCQLCVIIKEIDTTYEESNVEAKDEV